MYLLQLPIDYYITRFIFLLVIVVLLARRLLSALFLTIAVLFTFRLVSALFLALVALLVSLELSLIKFSRY